MNKLIRTLFTVYTVNGVTVVKLPLTSRWIMFTPMERIIAAGYTRGKPTVTLYTAGSSDRDIRIRSKSYVEDVIPPKAKQQLAD